MRRVRVLTTFLLCVAAAARAAHLEPVAVWGARGSGPGQFEYPTGVSVARNGQVFVSDMGNHRIQEFTPDGTYVREFGGPAGQYLETPAPGKFSSGPLCVLVDGDGNVWGGDGGLRPDGFVHRYAPDGQPTGDWGVYQGLGCDGFDWVATMVQGRSGRLFLLDPGKREVQRSGNGPPDGNPYFCPYVSFFSNAEAHPTSFAISGEDDETIFLNDVSRNQMRRYDWGSLGVIFGGPGDGPGQFGRVGPMASDHKQLLYVVDEVHHRIQAFTRGGSYLFEWGGHGGAPGQLECSGGCGMDVDESGYVWVADAGNHRIQKFATRFTPTVRRTWGEIKVRYR